MSKNLINQGILSFGGKDGGIISDASTATATLTGLKAAWIEVLSDTTFTAVSGWDYSNGTSYTYTGVNIPTGVATVAGAQLGAGYGKKIQNIAHTGGQIAYYTAIDD